MFRSANKQGRDRLSRRISRQMEHERVPFGGGTTLWRWSNSRDPFAMAVSFDDWNIGMLQMRWNSLESLI